MKKMLFFLLIGASISTHVPAQASYIAVNDPTAAKNVGGTASQAEDDARVISMLGWGIGLAAVIAIVAAVIHQSKGATPEQPDENT